MALELQKNILSFPGGLRATAAYSKGMPVKLGAAGFVVTSVLANDPLIIGVLEQDCAANDIVNIICGGIAQVKVAGIIAAGVALTTIVTTGVATSATAGQNSFAKTIEASGAANDLVSCWINPHGRG